jgi:putative hydrolase of the HAD superfamily
VNPEPRTLLIDADDTLWENNIYFERVTAEFVAALVKRGHRPSHAHELLWETEQRNIKITGYGSNAFCQSLHEVARAFHVDGLESWIVEREKELRQHPIDLMPGVKETLPLLHAQNQLILVSKGTPDEQLGKLRRSGLGPYFHKTEIVFEKDVPTYRELLRVHKLSAETTWMIGNSPRSDINPAKAAGLRTVFIPYHTTWQHEIEEISPEGETLVLENFSELAEHFGVRPIQEDKP